MEDDIKIIEKKKSIIDRTDESDDGEKSFDTTKDSEDIHAFRLRGVKSKPVSKVVDVLSYLWSYTKKYNNSKYKLLGIYIWTSENCNGNASCS